MADDTGRSEEQEKWSLSPIEGRVAKTFVEQGGNVSATARSVGTTRYKVNRILDSDSVRKRINDSMEQLGLDAPNVARLIAEGLGATREWFDYNTKKKTVVPDYVTRQKYLQLYLRLQQVDMSGRAGTMEAEEITTLTDEEISEVLDVTRQIDGE